MATLVNIDLEYMSIYLISVSDVLSFLEVLLHNKVSVALIVNYVSALKMMFIIYSILYGVLRTLK